MKDVRTLWNCTSAWILIAALGLPLLAAAGPLPAPLDLDPSFAGDGALIVEPGTRAVAHEGLIDETGEIVVLGEADNGNPSTREAIFQRILSDGTVGPVARYGASAPGCPVPRTFLTGIRLSNGDYLGGGYVQEGCGGLPRKFNAMQLNPVGQLVNEFDRVPFNNERAYIVGLGEQSDGGIIAVGFADQDFQDVTTFDMAVARFTAAGDLDPSFGSGGTFIFDRANNTDWSNDVVVDSADRILIAGYSTSASGDRDMVVIRLTPDGSLDTSFNGSGTFFFDGAGFPDTATSIDLTPGGRILVGGAFQNPQDQRNPVVLALNEDGSFDAGFGTGGVSEVDLGNSDAAITAIRYDAWRIYVTGWSRPVGGARIDLDAAVAVLRADGSPNPFFNGGQPRVFVFDPALGTQSDLPQSIDATADGEQIVVTGYTDDEPRARQRFGVARFIGLENALFIDGFEGGAP